MNFRIWFISAMYIALITLHSVACTSTQSKQVEAEGTYGANLLNCTAKSTTLAESRACEVQVKVTWMNADMANCAVNGSSVAQINACQAQVGLKWNLVDGGIWVAPVRVTASTDAGSDGGK